MTLRSTLHAFLRDAVNVAVYEARLPIRPMMPALVQTFVSGETTQTHSNRRSLMPRRVQIDAYANNDIEGDRLATELLYALDGFHGPMGELNIGWVTLMSDFDALPLEIKGGEIRYRRTLDFEVAYQEVPSAS